MSVVVLLYNDRGRPKGKECFLKEAFFYLEMYFSGSQVGGNSINLHVNLSDVSSMHSKSRG